MNYIEDKTKIVQTDILIIGGGSTGLWAAKGAKEKGVDVVIVDKGPRDWGGLASLAGGDLDAVLPNESIDDFVKDLVYYYDGLCDQELMEELYKYEAKKKGEEYRAEEWDWGEERATLFREKQEKYQNNGDYSIFNREDLDRVMALLEAKKKSK